MHEATTKNQAKDKKMSLEIGQKIQLEHGQIVTVAKSKPEWNEGYLHCFIDADNFAHWVDVRN